MPRQPIQIDPPDCACTECITGLYVPMDLATDQQLWLMMLGYISNATGFATSEFSVETRATIKRPSWE